MKFLLFLLVPLGLILHILSIINTIRFANTEIVHEMFCNSKESIFTITKRGRYGLWLSGKIFTVIPIRRFSFKLINQKTGEDIPLSVNLLHPRVSGVKTGRVELYLFYAEEGTYMLSLIDKKRVVGQENLSDINNVSKQFYGDSSFSVQVHKHTSWFIFVLHILGIIFGIGLIILGIITPIIL